MDCSVIIPTYNRVNLVKYTLDSLNSTYHKEIDIEVIVVDDGSTDNTWEFIKANYPNVVLVKNRGKGAPSARNEGLSIAKGKYIMYLDSDDLVGENYFREKLKALDGDRLLDACYGEYDCFKSDGDFSPNQIQFKHKYPIIEKKEESKQHLLYYLSGRYLPPNSIIWRADFLKKIRGHDTNLLINQDVELVIRAAFNGLKMVAVVDNTKVYIRSHSLDARVGSAENPEKLKQILALRKQIFTQLKANNLDSHENRAALSTYSFNFWKSTRHSFPEIANQFLQFAKEVSWPVEIKGDKVYRFLSKMVGPVNAVNIKYFILKRD